VTYVKKQSTTTRLKNTVIQVDFCSIRNTWMIMSKKVQFQITQQLKHVKKGSVSTELPDRCFRSFQLGSGRI
jgi:hypothetical protein